MERRFMNTVESDVHMQATEEGALPADDLAMNAILCSLRRFIRETIAINREDEGCV